MRLEIIRTEDGSDSIFVPELNEHYHSVHGAVQESMIVFINNGFRQLPPGNINILEIGFGTGLNALLTAIEADDNKIVKYTAIEKYPLGSDITGKLNYSSITGERDNELFRMIHDSPWEKLVKITGSFSLKKIKADFTDFNPEGFYNLVYYDAFAPNKQPGMWNENLFRKIAAVTGTGSVLVTYSSRGTVKRALRSCGFKVHLLPGPPGKREITRAVKT